MLMPRFAGRPMGASGRPGTALNLHESKRVQPQERATAGPSIVAYAMDDPKVFLWDQAVRGHDAEYGDGDASEG
jgi:hypothetical protein